MKKIEKLSTDFTDKVIKQFENITKFLETQGNMIVDLQKKVDFLCKYNKDEVALTFDTITYMYKQELHTVKSPTIGISSVEKNTDLYTIIKSKFRDTNYYFKLDKTTAQIVEITEEYEQIIKNKKSKKDSNAT